MVLLCSTLLRFTLHIKGMSKSLGLSFFGNSVQSRLSTGRPAEPDAADEEGTTHQQPHPPDVDAHTTFRMCPHYLSSRILNKLPNRWYRWKPSGPNPTAFSTSVDTFGIIPGGPWDNQGRASRLKKLRCSTYLPNQTFRRRSSHSTIISNSTTTSTTNQGR